MRYENIGITGAFAEFAAARMFAFDDPVRLRALFEDTGFQDVDTTSEVRRVARPSFAAYFELYEQGGGSLGQAYIALPEEARRAMREEVRRDLGDAGGPIEIEVEIRFASGRC